MPSVFARLVLATTGLASLVGSAQAQGSAVYDQNCSVCHQSGATGAPGAFPRLAGRAGALAATPAGRTVLISAALYGMSGKLQADHQVIFGVMPAFGQLSNAQISEALNYIAHLDGKTPRPFTPAEVAAVRSRPPLTPAQVNALARDPGLTQVAP